VGPSTRLPEGEVMMSWFSPIGQTGQNTIGTSKTNAFTLNFDQSTSEYFAYNPSSNYVLQNITGIDFEGIKVLASGYYYIEINASFQDGAGSSDNNGATILLQKSVGGNPGQELAYNQRPILGSTLNHIGSNKIQTTVLLSANDIVIVRAWGTNPQSGQPHYYQAGDISMSRLIP
jgi:hypothetical protein